MPVIPVLRRVVIAVVVLLFACTGDSEKGPPGAESTAPVFVDIGARVGIPTEETRSWGSAWADFVRSDGLPDLFVSRHARAPLLLANDGGTYSLLEEDFYPAYFDRHGCAWGEANGDRLIDFYCTQGADEGTGQGRNQLFVQTRSGWDDRAHILGVDDPFGRGRSVNWLDYEGDGDLDLFVGNKERSGQGNHLYANKGGVFVEVSAGVDERLRTVNSTWADWDVDGDPDLLVLQYLPDPVVAYENTGGRFERVRLPGVSAGGWQSAAWGDFDGDGRPDVHLVAENAAGLFVNEGPRFELRHLIPLSHGRMSAWLDVDNDGALDLFVVQGAPKKSPEDAALNEPDFLLVQRDGELEVVNGASFRGPEEGFGDAVSVADQDRDGKQDLFVTNGFGPRPASGRSVLLENRTRGGDWAGLELEGAPGNPLGFGASLRVSAGELTYHRELTDNFNFRAQSEVGYVHLGLGSASEGHVRLRWASGNVSCAQLSAGEITVVKEQDENTCT